MTNTKFEKRKLYDIILIFVLTIFHENYNVNLNTPVVSPNSSPIPSFNYILDIYGKVFSLLYEHSTILLLEHLMV